LVKGAPPGLASFAFSPAPVARQEEQDAALGVDIPEADYQKLGTLDATVAYLAAKLGAG
jgi:hypothetical protein